MQEENPKPPHKFLSGDISNYVESIRQKKQDQNIDEAEGLEDLDQEQSQGVEAPGDYDELALKKKVANVAGSSLTLFADAIIPVLIALLLKDDPDTFKASDSELAQLEAAFSDYAQIQGVDMPPWIVLFGTIISIYGFKAYSGVTKKRAAEKEKEESLKSE